MKQSFATWLRTQNAGLGFFLLALITQLNHAQDVAIGVSKSKVFDHISSWGFAFSLESAVLYAVMNKRHKYSYLFALFSVGINVAYYEAAMEKGQSMFYFQTQFSETWIKWLVSLILPFAIAFYSHTIARTDTTGSFDFLSYLQGQWKSLQDRFARKKLDLQEEVDSLQEAEPISDKYDRILNALQDGPKSKAELASLSGISQSTLFRANGGKAKGYLPEMENLHLIVNHLQGKQVVYTLNGENK